MNRIFAMLVLFSLLTSCSSSNSSENTDNNVLDQLSNILDYSISPDSQFDKSGLMWSDQGAWFAIVFLIQYLIMGDFQVLF